MIINVVSLILFFIINTIDFAVAAMCDAANTLASYRNLRLTPWDFLSRQSCNLKIGINHNLSISIISISLHPPPFSFLDNFISFSWLIAMARTPKTV